MKRKNSGRQYGLFCLVFIILVFWSPITVSAIQQVAPDEYVTWDITGGSSNVWDNTDGILMLGKNSTHNIFVTNIIDDLVPNITLGSALDSVSESLIIVSNVGIGNVDLSNFLVPTGTTSLLLVIAAGYDIPAPGPGDSGGDADWFTFNIDGEATGTCEDQIATSIVGDAPLQADGDDPTPDSTAGIGYITLPSLAPGHPGLSVEIHILCGYTSGSLTALVSSDTGVDMAEDSYIQATGVLSGIYWSGDVIATGNAGITFNLDGDAGVGVGTISFRSLQVFGGAAGINFDADGATSLTVSNGITINSNAFGGIDMDFDLNSGTPDGVGTVSIGGIYVAGSGDHDLTIDGGQSGFLSTVSLGAVYVTGASSSDITITTSSNGSFKGMVTVSSIDNNSSGDSDITIMPAGVGDMAGFTATGLISNDAFPVLGQIVIGSPNGSMGDISLAGIILRSTYESGDITFQGESIGNIISSGAIQTSTWAAGDILFNAQGIMDFGSIGDITVNGNINSGHSGSFINFWANDDIGDIDVEGSVGGNGSVAFFADNGGTAETGNIGTITVTNATGTANLGNGAGAVAFSAVDIGNITADNIGSTGAGAVTFTADGLDATDGTGGGLIGTLTVTNDIADTAAVTFTADDGMGNVSIGADAAQGGNLTFDVNQDATDDTGSMGTITAQTLGDAAGVTLVIIDTNSGATDNTTERSVGAITVTDGEAGLQITAAGDVGNISVTGDSGAGNDLYINAMNLDAAGDGANTDIPDLGTITLADTASDDTLTLAGASWVIPGTMGAITVGGSDAGDVMALGAFSISVYNGDDIADGFDSAYAGTVDSTISITAGDITTGGGTITANTRAASNLFTYVEAGETFAVTTASDVTGQIAFTPGATNSVAITELAGTSTSDDLQVTTSGTSSFNVSAITPAADGLDIRNI
ncbi:MAG: hypothetical protein JW860_04925, partial [Sedimentisphaerales bacterium]|nr:hypothetical protein [Sedimentisphaerales bacterium]